MEQSPGLAINLQVLYHYILKSPDIAFGKVGRSEMATLIFIHHSPGLGF